MISERDLEEMESRIMHEIHQLQYHTGIGILVLGNLILTEGNKQMADLTRLTNEVAENTSAVASAVALLNELAQLLRDAADDPAAVNALADQLDASTNALAEAITANTPAEGEPEPEEPPVEPVEMPFKSEQQRRYLWAKHPKIARRWADEAKGKETAWPEQFCPETIRAIKISS